MVVAQLVRAPDCGSGGRRFETDLPPVEGSRKTPFFCALSFVFLTQKGVFLVNEINRLEAKRGFICSFKHNDKSITK